MHTRFGDNRFGWLRGQSSAFLIDFAGRPYNTLTLPCERVIIIIIIMQRRSSELPWTAWNTEEKCE